MLTNTKETVLMSVDFTHHRVENGQFFVFKVVLG